MFGFMFILKFKLGSCKEKSLKFAVSERKNWKLDKMAKRKLKMERYKALLSFNLKNFKHLQIVPKEGRTI